MLGDSESTKFPIEILRIFGAICLFGIIKTRNHSPKIDVKEAIQTLNSLSDRGDRISQLSWPLARDFGIPTFNFDPNISEPLPANRPHFIELCKNQSTFGDSFAMRQLGGRYL
jgi:hypothetical protein